MNNFLANQNEKGLSTGEGGNNVKQCNWRGKREN